VSTAISAKGLDVSIAGSRILQGVDLDVQPNTITALLGRNGVGKTTTLKALLGLLPSDGDRSLLGADVRGWPVHKVVQHGVGYVPEDREVFAGLTVRENLRLAEPRKRGKPEYDRVFTLFPELKRRGAQLAGTLSGGQQQMLAIGRVLLDDKPLLLVDEPTKGLSPRFVTEVTAALAEIGRTATVFMVEQNVHVVRELARHIVVLDHGKVVHAGPAGDLDDEGLVRRLLGVSA
jgi:branched-chain amino acid transport system ATP-binding protein